MHSLAVRVALLAFVLAPALAPAPASSQASAVRSLGSVLAPWDREGHETLDTVRQLGRTARTAPTPDARLEARLRRASIALDLLLVSHLGADRAVPLPRLADALGVPRSDAPHAGIEAYLRRELRVLASTPHGPAAREALGALDLHAALARGDQAIDWSRHRGSRRDILLVTAAADALGISGDPARLPPIAPDPCATPSSPCGAPWRTLAPDSRRELASMLEVSRTLRRIGERARAGDPLSRALHDRIALATARLETTALRPIPRLERDRDLLAGEEGELVRASVLVLVRRREVRVLSIPALRVRDGEIVAPADLREEPDVVRLPWRLSGPAAPIVEVSRAIAAHGPERRPIAIAVAPRVRSHVLARVLLSAAEIARGPITLVRRAPDGTLRGAPVTLLTTDRELTGRDLQVNVQSGTYALSRRDRRITLRLPEVRQRATEGISFAHLDSLIERLPHRRVVVRAEPDIPARDVMDVAWRAVVAGDPLALRAR